MARGPARGRRVAPGRTTVTAAAQPVAVRIARPRSARASPNREIPQLWEILREASRSLPLNPIRDRRPLVLVQMPAVASSPRCASPRRHTGMLAKPRPPTLRFGSDGRWSTRRRSTADSARAARAAMTVARSRRAAGRQVSSPWARQARRNPCARSALLGFARMSGHPVIAAPPPQPPAAAARGAHRGQRDAFGARARAGLAVGARRRRGAGRVHDRGGGAAAVRRLGRQADHRRRGRGARGACRGRRARPRSDRAVRLVALELGAVAAMAGCERVLGLVRQLVGLRLGIDLNVRILEKAEKLSLRHFEDATFYDKLTRARREASTRPLSLIQSNFQVIRHGLTLAGYVALLIGFSGWMALAVLVATVPAFIAEARFSGAAFRLRNWRSPDSRRLTYLEYVLGNDEHAKEVKLFGLAPLLLGRYRRLAETFFADDRRLAVRRMAWGYALSLVSTVVFYGCYAMIVAATVRGRLSLGDMTLYLVAFRQGQQSFQAVLSALGGMYEDTLYMSNLFEYFAIRRRRTGRRSGRWRSCAPRRGSASRASASGTRRRRRGRRRRRRGQVGAARRRRVRPQGAEPGAGRRERRGQDDVHQAARRPLRSDGGARAAGRARRARLGRARAARAHRRHLPGLQRVPAGAARERRVRQRRSPGRRAARRARGRSGRREGAGGDAGGRAWTRSSGAGSRAASSCRAGSGRRWRSRARSCARRPTS